MSLSDDIKDTISNALPLNVHCEACDRDVDITELLTESEWRYLLSDILQLVVDEIQK